MKELQGTPHTGVLYEMLNEFRDELRELNTNSADTDRRLSLLREQLNQKKKEQITYTYGEDLALFNKRVSDHASSIGAIEEECEALKVDNKWSIDRREQLTKWIATVEFVLDSKPQTVQTPLHSAPVMTSFSSPAKAEPRQEKSEIEEGRILPSFLNNVTKHRRIMVDIMDVFDANGNKPMSVRQILMAKGLKMTSQPTIDVCLKAYHSHFEKIANPTGARGKFVRIAAKYVQGGNVPVSQNPPTPEPRQDHKVPLAKIIKPETKQEEEEMGFYEKELHAIFEQNGNNWNDLGTLFQKMQSRNQSKKFKQIIKGVTRCIERHPNHFERREVGYPKPYFEYRSVKVAEPKNDEERFLLDVHESDAHIMKLVYTLLQGETDYTSITDVRNLVVGEFKDQDVHRVMDKVDTTIMKYLHKFHVKGTDMSKTIYIKIKELSQVAAHS